MTDGSISYGTAHYRVVRDRGPARNLTCEHCDEPARDWAYDGLDPNEVVGSTGNGSSVRAWSGDASHYLALCRACHVAQDRKGRTYGPARWRGAEHRRIRQNATNHYR